MLADCFTKNKIHMDLGLFATFIITFIVSLSFILHSFIFLNIFNIADLIALAISIGMIYYYFKIIRYNNSLRYFIPWQLFESYFYPYIKVRIIYWLALIGFIIFGVIEKAIFEVNFWIVIVLYSVVLLLFSRDVMSSLIINGKMEDKIIDLMCQKNSIDKHLIDSNETITSETSDMYLDYLIKKIQAPRRLSSLLFGFDVLVPNIDQTDIRKILSSPDYSQKLKLKVYVPEVLDPSSRNNLDRMLDCAIESSVMLLGFEHGFRAKNSWYNSGRRSNR